MVMVGERPSPANIGDRDGKGCVLQSAEQPFLDGLELPADVLLVAHEDQAHVQVPVDVQAAVVVHASAEDPAVGGSGRARVGDPDVRRQGRGETPGIGSEEAAS